MGRTKMVGHRTFSTAGVNTVTLVPLPQVDRDLWGQGPIEPDFLRLVRGWPDVVDVQVQLRVDYTRDPATGEVWLGHTPSENFARSSDDLLQRTCYPDALVRFGHRQPLLVEVKSARHADDPDLAVKWRACALYADANGFEFRVVTDTEIRTAAFERTALLSRYRRTTVPFATRLAAVAVVVACPGLSCAEVAGRLPHPRPHALAFVYALVAQDQLALQEPDAPLSPGALLQPRSN